MDEDPSDSGREETDAPARPEDSAPESGLPTVACSRCDREWELDYELDELQVGNRAVEQFAMDHHRHTGHYPDGVRPWIARCRHCPDREAFLAERPARRFANTHARHTGHTVELGEPEDGEKLVQPD